MAGEFDLIAKYFHRVSRQARPAAVPGLAPGVMSGVVLGIGDDAALFAPTPGTELAISTDTLVAGVHFPLDTPAADIGWKSLAVNLSDLAAMGATPRACLLALTLPTGDEPWVAAFANGFFALADSNNCALIGGDMSRGPLSITVTVLGEVPTGTALRRSGARPDDLVCVSGTPGVAALGLQRWQIGNRDVQDPAIVQLLRPAPRITLGCALRGVANAAIDISDGLIGDLAHLLRASSVDGSMVLGAELQLASLPRSSTLAALADEAAWELMLAGGDDYELCFTVPPAKLSALHAAAAQASVPVAVIGRVTNDGSLRCLGSDGREWMPARKSWEHFVR